LRAAALFFEESASLPADPRLHTPRESAFTAKTGRFPLLQFAFLKYSTCLVLFGQPIESPVKEKKCILRATLDN